MAYLYVVKKGCEFRLDGKHFSTGDQLSGDLAFKLEGEPHLLGFCLRTAAPEPEVTPPPVLPKVATDKTAAPA